MSKRPEWLKVRIPAGENYIEVRRILRSWPLREQIAFFERELGVPLVEEVESGKLFPQSQSARHVRDADVRWMTPES